MYVFDIETDGLVSTKIHVLSFCNLETGKIKSLTDYSAMRHFFSRENLTLIGHNISRFDVPALEKILDIKVSARLIDTLALSWYLEFNRNKHGLESWGEELGVKKPEIGDWKGLPLEKYKHRCEEDVKINVQLWYKLQKKLHTLYGSEEEGDRLIDYLTFKLDCAAEQERSKWKLDAGLAEESLLQLQAEKEKKIFVLEKAMPEVPKYSKRLKPKVMELAGGKLSSLGQKWIALLEEQGLPLNHNEEVKVVKRYEPPNPNSSKQVKDWLFSLGWEPETFKYVPDGDGERSIPQIKPARDDGVCKSVKKLIDKDPAVSALDGLTIINHRMAILKGFLGAVDDEGYVKAEVQGLTNTMRFKHAVCVNLPGVDKPYGEVIRGCLIAPEGYELCGSDMASLEDRTKQHYMWRYDKAYVKEMMTPDFDPHLDLAVSAGALTEEQAQAHKDEREDHDGVRKVYKMVNYACVYGAGGQKIARELKIKKGEGDKLVKAYWDRNWAVRAIPKIVKTKVEFGSMWLFNPVSKLWYSLRSEKDIFSTLNQGTGVWCFDTWVKNVREKRPQLTAQFHDEVVLCIKKGYRSQCEGMLRQAIAETNRELKLNRKLDVDVKFGETYADIH